MDKKSVLKYYKKAMTSFYFRPTKIFELVTSMRSYDEFKWLFDTGFMVLKNLFKRKNKVKESITVKM